MDFIPENRRDRWWQPFTYEYEVQVSVGEDDRSINLDFFSSWTIEQVEEFMENFFDKMQPNYYELFDNEERHARPAKHN
jgi:hypothetical protein